MSQSVVDVGVIANTKSSKYLDVIAITSSQSWSPPKDCIADIVVIGAGGAGAGGSQYQSARYSASGGGAGGFCKKLDANLLKSNSYTLTVGAGGPKVRGSTRFYGTDGGSSSFVGEGLHLTSNGGRGGRSHTASVNVSQGGTASGGDINRTGGSSTISSNYMNASGGGAVAVIDSALANTVSNDGAGIASNGNGAMFLSDLDFLGVGMLRDIKPNKHFTQFSFSAMRRFPLFDTPGLGVGGQGFRVQGIEGGSSSTAEYFRGQDGGMFAGGGALVNSWSGRPNNLHGELSAGNGGVGGGGGAIYSDVFGINNGAGGDGVIFIAIKEYL